MTALQVLHYRCADPAVLQLSSSGRLLSQEAMPASTLPRAAWDVVNASDRAREAAAAHPWNAHHGGLTNSISTIAHAVAVAAAAVPWGQPPLSGGGATGIGRERALRDNAPSAQRHTLLPGRWLKGGGGGGGGGPREDDEEAEYDTEVFCASDPCGDGGRSYGPGGGSCLPAPTLLRSACYLPRAPRSHAPTVPRAGASVRRTARSASTSKTTRAAARSRLITWGWRWLSSYRYRPHRPPTPTAPTAPIVASQPPGTTLRPRHVPLHKPSPPTSIPMCQLCR